MPLPIETARLFLRPFRESDLTAFVAYRSDPEVARYQGWEAPYSLEEGQRFMREMSAARPDSRGQWYQVAIEQRETGELIGDCAFKLSVDGKQAEIGLTLSRQAQRQGYGTEAAISLLRYLFGERDLHRVYANCDEENEAAWRGLENIGMRREAHFVENLDFKGRWASEYWYGMLDREWNQVERRRS